MTLIFGYATWYDAIWSVRSLSSAGVDVHPLSRTVPEPPAPELLVPPQAVSSTAAIAASANPSRVERMLPPPLISRPLLHPGVPSQTEMCIAFTVGHLLSTSVTGYWKSLGCPRLVLT